MGLPGFGAAIARSTTSFIDGSRLTTSPESM